MLPYLNSSMMTVGYDETVYPPLESVPKRFAISRRNEWMVRESDIVVAYVTHSWGGAAKTLEYARRKKKQIFLCGGSDMAGTSATLLAKRWESALLVNVDNDTLSRLLASDEAMEALMRIEGFRSLNEDIKTIINKSEAVKKAKKESENLTPKEKKELSDEEKEYKSKRKMIQEKLIKFATRVPVFMYLTDYREYSLKDVITQLEPELFRKVTGLSVKDFELLVSLNVFNEALMNDAVYKFKRYEDASLISCKQKGDFFLLRIPFTLFTLFQRFSGACGLSSKASVFVSAISSATDRTTSCVCASCISRMCVRMLYSAAPIVSKAAAAISSPAFIICLPMLLASSSNRVTAPSTISRKSVMLLPVFQR